MAAVAKARPRQAALVGPLLKAILLLLGCLADPASAQVDLTGLWGERLHEDEPHRNDGPEVGDYTGLPINDAARWRADSWMASIQTLPERQCIPHPVPYAFRGPNNLRISNEIDPVTQQVIAVRTHIGYMAPQRRIYLDGRPHPPEYAPHSWQGFSTGRWQGNALVVTTTHIKAGYIQRNGVPHSDRVRLTEYFIRHGNYLTHVSVIEDPVYLTEPFIRTTNWQLDPYLRFRAYPCDIVVEIAGREKGAVPHHRPDQNPHLTGFERRLGLSHDAVRGGAETTYPEFGAQRPGPGSRIAGSSGVRPPQKESK